MIHDIRNTSKWLNVEERALLYLTTRGDDFFPSPLAVYFDIQQNQIDEVDNREGITLSPNPFSPDNDGIDDRLFIHYILDQPGYILTARVFDRYGRLVGHLVEHQIIGI